jgi:hypothetical protein
MATGDTLFLNATVRTLDPANPLAEAVLVRGGRIEAVGGAAELRANASGAREVDLGGATVLPGFIESHNHFLFAGQAFTQVDVRSSAVDSVADIQRLLRERALATEPGEWVIGRGYDQTLLAENRHPTRHDLDEVTPHHPAVIRHISYHGLVANSVALELAGLDRNTPDQPGGEILRDEHGEPTGVLLEDPAMDLVLDHIPATDAAGLREALGMARDQYLPTGVSAVHDALIGSRAQIDAYAAAIAAGELPIRAYLMIAPELYDGVLEGQSGDLGPSYKYLDRGVNEIIAETLPASAYSTYECPMSVVIGDFNGHGVGAPRLPAPGERRGQEPAVRLPGPSLRRRRGGRLGRGLVHAFPERLLDLAALDATRADPEAFHGGADPRPDPLEVGAELALGLPGDLHSHAALVLRETAVGVLVTHLDPLPANGAFPRHRDSPLSSEGNPEL